MAVVVRSSDLRTRKGASGVPYLDAITSREGAGRVYAALVVIPPRSETVPHYHVNTETILFQLTGRAATYFGPELAEVLWTGPGDFLFIAPGEIHQGVNATDEPAEAVVFRDREVEEVVEVPVRRRPEG